MIKKRLTITIGFTDKAEEVEQRTKELKARGITQATIYYMGLKVLEDKNERN